MATSKPSTDAALKSRDGDVVSYLLHVPGHGVIGLKVRMVAGSRHEVEPLAAAAFHEENP